MATNVIASRPPKHRPIGLSTACAKINSLHLQVENRILVSADTELNWLYQFKNLTAPYHQIIGVPVYEDGASCGKYLGGHSAICLSFIITKYILLGGGASVLPLEEIAFEGRIDKKLTSNKQITCPEKLY